MLIHNIVGRKLSYKKKLLFFLLLIGIVPMLLLDWVTSHLFVQQIQQEADRNQRLTLHLLYDTLNDKISDITLSSLSLASNIVLEKSVAAGPGPESFPLTMDMIQTIRRSLAYFPLKLNVSVLYLKHNYVYSDLHIAQTLEETSYPDILRTIVPPNHSPFYIMPDTFPSQPDLLAFRPIPLNSMYTEGVLVTHLSSTDLYGLIDDLELDRRKKIYVIDEKGRVFFSRSPEEIGTVLTADDDLYSYWLDPAAYGDNVVLDHIPYTASAQKLDFTNWTCIVMTPYEELAQKTTQTRQAMLSIEALFVLLCTAILFFGFRRLFRPFQSVLAQIQLAGGAAPPSDNEMEALHTVLHRLISTNKQLQDEIKEQLPLAKERFYQFLINGELDEHEIKRLADRYDLPLYGAWVYVGVVRVDDYIGFQQTYRGRERSVLHDALRKAMKELGGDRVPSVTFVPEPGQVVVLFAAEKADNAVLEQISGGIQQFRAQVANDFGFTISAAISDARREYDCYRAGYQEAMHILSYRLLFGHNVTMTSEDIGKRALLPSEESVLRHPKSIVSQLLQGHTEGAILELEQWLEDVRRYAPSSEHAVGWVSYLLGELGYKLDEVGCPLHEIVSYDFFARLHKMTGLSEVRTWLEEELFAEVACRLELLLDSKSKRVVRQVEAYLNERYEEDITLLWTADRFEISPSFLSRIFKETTGRSFSDYLLEIRLNKAMEWLTHTDWPLQYISEKLCYSNVQNFSRIFKKIIGAPPGEYRRQRRNESRSS
ncbi:helix-turn-helix domain-containing protein [Paenibacillus hodogayensis]|uniref:Helix-turn-helix domain-containing protein n=1 Tax=Paenibacillus hodogayensis TaxID=279208 RepID=A0ABV5W7C5_9BACL